MKYAQLVGKPRREFTLHGDYIAIKSTPFFGNHTETNYEYKALTSRASNALVRQEPFFNYLLLTALILMFAVTLFFDEYQEHAKLIASFLGCLCFLFLFMAFRLRKRIPYLIFHNLEGTILFDIGGESEEYHQFIFELKKRVSESKK